MVDEKYVIVEEYEPPRDRHIREQVEGLNLTLQNIESKRSLRKRRALVDRFYSEFINEVPLKGKVVSPKFVKPMADIVRLAGREYTPHLDKALLALTGTTHYADGKRTNREIAELERERRKSEQVLYNLC